MTKEDQMTAVHEKLDLKNYIPYRLAVLSGQIGLTSARLYRRHFGFGLREWRMVAVLGDRGEKSLSDLSRVAKVDTGTATRALSALHRDGFVAKRADGTDQRKMLFELTPKGGAVYDRVVQGALKREALLTQTLSDKDRKEFMRLLRLLETQSEKLDGFDPY